MTKQPQKESDRTSTASTRAKARWAILRSALLQKKSQTNDASGTGAGDDGIISSRRNNNKNCFDYSIHRFPGFQLLDCHTVIPKPPATATTVPTEWEDSNILEYEIPFLFNNEKRELPNRPPKKRILRIQTQERTHKNNDQQAKVTNLKELMSHVHHGVDNTGNTRVWDSATTLAYLVFCGNGEGKEKKVDPTIDALLPSRIKDIVNIYSSPGAVDSPCIGIQKTLLSLSNPYYYYENNGDGMNNNSKNVLKVVELGAGMAGLTSLALAALHISSSLDMSDTFIQKEDFPDIEVTITDGHPTAVQNNQVCSDLTRSLYYNGTTPIDGTDNVEESSSKRTSGSKQIRCHTLLWKDTQEGAEECRKILESNSKSYQDGTPHQPSLCFDLCLVSDCVHFVDFHSALVATIGRLLRIGGKCLLCQPCRGESLNKFIELVHAVNCGSQQQGGILFDVALYDKCDENILSMHNIQMEKKSRGEDSDGYDPNIHYPMLLILTKIRDFDEILDISTALNHINKS